MSTSSHDAEIQALFHAALDRPDPDARRSLLARERATRPDVVARVEVLLRAHDDLGDFLAGHASGGSTAEQPGQWIGRYKLLELLGEGGFGSVWMAEQREPVKRRVALKVIKLGMDTKQVIARFEAERQALAMMDHENIARVLDAGATDSGRPYFVMELVRGVAIVEYCDRERLDTRARLDLFTSVCNAIQHAHQKGVIHRDIKPSNVLVTLHDGVPVPKVIDFGIAKATQGELTAKTLFTEHRQMLGTPAYMSPEQAEMSGLAVDTRADVYSLGVLLYELLTGTTPFDVKDLMEKGFAEMVRVIREVEPHKPSTRVSTLGRSATRAAEMRHVDVSRLGVLLRGDLDWIVMKCLEKDRARRYATANALALDVQRHIADEPVSAGPPSRVYRLQKFVRRNRAAVAVGALIVLLLIAGVAGTTTMMLRAMDAEGRARLAADSARVAADAERARADELDRVAGFQATQMADVNAARMGQTIESDLVREIQEVLRRDGRPAAEVEAQARELGRLLERVNMTNVALRAIDEHVVQSAIRAVEPAFADRPDMQANMLTRLAITLSTLGLHEQALVPLRRALEICQANVGVDHEDTARVQNSIAVNLQSLGRHAEAEGFLRPAVETMRRHLSEGDFGRLTLEYGWASLLQDLHREAESEAAYRETLLACRRALGDEHELTIKVLNGFGTFLVEVGRPDEAEEYFRIALAADRKRLGDDHPETIAALSNVAKSLHAQGKDEEAEPLAREATDIARHALGDDHPFTTNALFTLYEVVTALGRGKEGESLIAEIAERWMRTLGPTHAQTLVAINRVSSLYRMEGRMTESLALADTWLAAVRREGTTHLDVYDSVLATLGVDHMKLGQFTAAEPVLRECLERRGRKSRTSYLYRNAQSLLGGCLAGQGLHEEADPLLVEGYESMDPPPKSMQRKLDALERLIGHYDAWSKPERAAYYRAQLDDVRAEVERAR